MAQKPELEKMKELLITRVLERIGTEKDNAICLAIRLLICHHFNIPNHEDLPALLQTQEEDGSYGVGWYYAFGRSNVKIGHRGFTCTLAAEAIQAYTKGGKM